MRKFLATHRPLSADARAQLQSMHEGLPLSLLQDALQTSAYTLARTKAGAPLLLSEASRLEQRIKSFWERRSAA